MVTAVHIQQLKAGCLLGNHVGSYPDGLLVVDSRLSIRKWWTLSWNYWTAGCWLLMVHILMVLSNIHPLLVMATLLVRRWSTNWWIKWFLLSGGICDVTHSMSWDYSVWRIIINVRLIIHDWPLFIMKFVLFGVLGLIFTRKSTGQFLQW